jgi:hypothetical protein
MSEEERGERGTGQVEKEEKAERRDVARKLDAAGWALFLIWVGIALLAKVSLGIGLIGVGVITLAGQAVRKAFKLKPEILWLVVGIVFVVAGLWQHYKPKVELVPILLILAGLALLVSMCRKKGPGTCC